MRLQRQPQKNVRGYCLHNIATIKEPSADGSQHVNINTNVSGGLRSGIGSSTEPRGSAMVHWQWFGTANLSCSHRGLSLCLRWCQTCLTAAILRRREGWALLVQLPLSFREISGMSRILNSEFQPRWSPYKITGSKLLASPFWEHTFSEPILSEHRSFIF